MRHILLCFVLFICVLPSFAQDDDDPVTVTLVNESDEIACGFAVIPLDDMEFDPDLFFEMTDDDQTRSAEVPVDTYMIGLIDCEGGIIKTYTYVELTDDMTLTYTGEEGAEDEAAFTREPVTFTLTNESGAEICPVVIAPESAITPEGLSRDYVYDMSDKQTLDLEITPDIYVIAMFSCDDELIVDVGGFRIYDALTINFPDDIQDYSTAEMLLGRGLTAYNDEDYAAAYSGFEFAMTFYEPLTNKAMKALTMQYMGNALQEQGELDDALNFYNRALVIQEALDIQEDSGITFARIGDVYRKQEDYDSAIDSYKQALIVLQRVANYEMLTLTWLNIADVYQIQKSYGDALSVYDALLTITRESGNREGEAAILADIACTYGRMENPTEATFNYLEAMSLYLAMGDIDQEQQLIEELFTLYEDTGCYDVALMLANIASRDDLTERINDTIAELDDDTRDNPPEICEQFEN